MSRTALVILDCLRCGHLHSEWPGAYPMSMRNDRAMDRDA